MGHNYFIEDAVEEDLIIQYNLAIHTKPSFSLLTSDQRPTSFWITNTFNTIQHNHAAGGRVLELRIRTCPRKFRKLKKK